MGNTHRSQLAVARVLAKCFHPAKDGSRVQFPSKSQPLSWSPRPLAETGEEPSIGQVTGAERREILGNFLLRNTLPKKRCNVLKGYASAAKDRFSPQQVGIRNNAPSAPAEC